METIYSKALEQVRNGARFVVNLETRSVRINGKYIIRNSEVPEGETLIDEKPEDPIKYLEDLWLQHYRSLPSERSQSVRRLYFKALPEHELSMDDVMFGVRREEAQFILEFTLLAFILNGTITWESFSDTGKVIWFWKSPRFPKFIILKQWVLPENKKQL